MTSSAGQSHRARSLPDRATARLTERPLGPLVHIERERGLPRWSTLRHLSHGRTGFCWSYSAHSDQLGPALASSGHSVSLSCEVRLCAVSWTERCRAAPRRAAPSALSPRPAAPSRTRSLRYSLPLSGQAVAGRPSPHRSRVGRRR